MRFALRCALLATITLAAYAASTYTEWTPASAQSVGFRDIIGSGIVSVPDTTGPPTSSATAPAATAVPTTTLAPNGSIGTGTATTSPMATMVPLATSTPYPLDVNSLPRLARVPEAIGQSNEAMIDSSGGEVGAADGRASVRIQAGTFTEPLDIKITRLDEHEQPLPPSPLPFVGVWRFDALDVNHADAAVHTFPADVTIVLHFTSDDLSGLLPQSLTLWTFDDVAKQWVRVPSQLDLPHLVLTAQVSHFTDYGATSSNIVNTAPMLDSRNVDLHSGAATFSLPIQVPAGVGGLTPDLTLSYDSGRVSDMHNYDQGTSWAGIGWDLDVPHVEVNYIPQSSPRVFLSLGSSGGEIMPDGTQDPDGWWVWRGRNEQYLRIRTSCTTFNCPWIVTDQKGTQYVFGADVTSTSNDPSYGRWYYDQASPYSRHYYRFDLAYQIDALYVPNVSGNRIDYSYWYQIIGDHARWSANPRPQYVAAGYVSRISYNGGSAVISFNGGDFVNSSLNHQIYDNPCDYNAYYQPNYGGCRRNDTPWSPIAGCPYFAPLVAETRRLTDIEVTVDGQLARKYVLSYNTDGNTNNSFFLNGNTCVTAQNEGTNRLNSLSLFGNDGASQGAMPLYTMGFQYQTLSSMFYDPNGVGVIEYDWPYLKSVSNGFGGSDTFEYQDLGENVNRNFSREVVVKETRSTGGGGCCVEPDAVERYQYANGPARFRYPNPYTGQNDNFNSEYRGFGSVTEQDSYSVNGQTVHDQTVHQYYTTSGSGDFTTSWNDEVRTGREYDTQVFDSSGTVVSHTSTTWNVLPIANSTGFGGEFVNFVYASEVDTTTGSGSSAMTTYNLSTFDINNGTGMDTGNITEVDEYAGAPPGGTRQVSTVTHYQRNHTAWVVVPQDVQKLDASGTLLSYNRNYYDGANTSTPASPPLVGLLTAMAQQICGPAPASARCSNPSSTTWSSSYYVYDSNGRPFRVSVPTFTNPEGQTPPPGSSLGWLPDVVPQVPFSLSHFDTATHPSPDWTENELGQRTSYQYDWVLGKPIQVTQPNSNILGYEYDTFGRLAAYWDSLDAAGCPGPSCLPTKSISYAWGVPNALNQTITQERVNTGTSDVRTVVSCTDGFGRELDHRESYLGTGLSEVRTDYDGRGLKFMETQPGSTDGSAACPTVLPDMSYFNRTAYTYDALGNVETTNFLPLGPASPETCSDPGSTPVCRKTSVDGNTTTTIDENKHKTIETLDPSTRETTVEQDFGTGTGMDAWTAYATTTYKYDALGRLTDVWDPQNNHTSMAYDLAGRKTSMNDPDMGNWTYPSYDAAGNLLQESDAIGTTTTMTYDALNRLTTKSYSNGDPTVTYRYDAYFPDQGSTSWCGEDARTAIGMRTKMEDGAGDEFTCFDVRGRAVNGIRYVDGIHYTTATQYNDLDTAKELTYPDGEVVDYQIGSVGDVTGATSTTFGQTIYSNAQRTPWGAPYELTLGNNVTAGIGYDTRSRISGFGAGSVQAVVVNHDDASNVINTFEWYGNGEYVQYTYDALNRLTTASGYLNGSASYTYDTIGNLKSKQEGASDLTTLSYPPSGPSSVHPHAVTRTTGTESLSLGYDANGNLANEGANTYTYDAANRLVNRPQSSGSTQYVYDGNGTLLMRSDIGSPQTITLRPEAQGAYTSWTGNPYNDPQQHYQNVQEHYPDDDGSYIGAAGTRLIDTHRYPSANVPAGSIIDKVTLKFRWEGTGQTSGALYPEYVQNGDEAIDSLHLVSTSSGYVDDSWDLTKNPITNRPWTTTDVNAGMEFGFRTLYSNYGVRVTQAWIDITYRPATSTTTYIGGIYEKNGDGTAVKYYKGLNRTVMVRQVPAGGGSGTQYWPLYDQVGSTVGMFDSNGALVSSQRYWPYGGTREAQLSPPLPLVTQTDKLYTAQQQESPTSDVLGLYDYKARFYSATLGRFVSADTLVNDGLNRYTYGRNNPIRYSDPSGLCTAGLRALVPGFDCTKGVTESFIRCAFQRGACEGDDATALAWQKFALWVIGDLEFYQRVIGWVQSDADFFHTIMNIRRFDIIYDAYIENSFSITGNPSLDDGVGSVETVSGSIAGVVHFVLDYSYIDFRIGAYVDEIVENGVVFKPSEYTEDFIMGVQLRYGAKDIGSNASFAGTPAAIPNELNRSFFFSLFRPHEFKMRVSLGVNLWNLDIVPACPKACSDTGATYTDWLDVTPIILMGD